jgi:CheY-like chemotaxis protein/HAMP domain-containing protein
VDVRGEILALKNTVNTMVDQLNSFASEVTRVARDVGTEGILGGQASVSGAAGVWKDLTDNVNVMAANLTDQVRNIARVVTAVARGNLKQKLTVQAKGEIAALTDTINEMTDTLAIFADQVTTVAREVGVEGQLGGQASVPGAAGIWKDLTDNVNQLAANLTTQVRAIAEVATAVTRGDLTRSIIVAARGEVAELKDNINTMIRNLRETTQQNAEQDWLKTNLARFTRLLQGQRDALTVSSMLLSELSPLVGASHAVVYVIRPETDDGSSAVPVLKLLASYGYTGRKGLPAKWAIGEGLVGQCALERQRILLTNVPPGYIEITSGLGEAAPLNIVVLPVVFEKDVKAVIELASFERFSPTHITFLEQLTESLGIVLNTIEATMRTEELLTQSQSLAGELQSRQQELQNTNAELEEKARLLASQNTEVERKNQEVEEARQALEEKAAQLALTSKYKSEFLANMSHELRTPLNSLLILAGQLATNAEGNLGEKQVDYARTIQASGTDLLTLINDILDLSKIESGTVTVEVEEALLSDVRDQIDRMFRHIAEARGLDFSVELDPALPLVIYTDADRLQQVLKNLASNAIKFTEQGEVRLRIYPARSGWDPEHEVLNRAQRVLAFEVRDTGIGVPPDKQKLIFEAFQQAEGGASRKYPGTGLGLAISREIAHLLSGELQLTKSVVGQGSVFTFYLAESPEAHSRLKSRSTARLAGPNAAADAHAEAFADDRVRLQAGDLPVLIVEDDRAFARILLNKAHGHGFKVVVATRGEEVLTLARQYRPLAITLDLGLPDLDGRVVLDRLKLDPATRHIPVHIISAEDDRRHGLGHGAFGYLVKPVDETVLGRTFDAFRDFATRRSRKLLLAEDNLAEQQAVSALLEGDDLEIRPVATGKEALAALGAERFDCLVLDLKLPDISGFEVLKRLEADVSLRDMPAIVYTGRDLTRKESAQLQKAARTIIVKDVRSPERLLAETTLFLHRNIALLPEAKRQMLERVYQSDAPLTGKRILIVDDDVRNLYAITGVLESHRMEVFVAKNGRSAIDLLDQAPETDLVLMDIMMPQMDGYDTMRAIRRNSKFRALPIIALTAKAMKGDREKCLEAGASDYISKPVNVDQLLSLMRIWLYR